MKNTEQKLKGKRENNKLTVKKKDNQSYSRALCKFFSQYLCALDNIRNICHCNGEKIFCRLQKGSKSPRLIFI